MYNLAEKLFVVAVVIFLILIFYYEDDNYRNDLREYYYCKPYNNIEDPPLPPITSLELENFEKSFINFNIKYKCQQKLYTRKQFYIIRKARN